MLIGAGPRVEHRCSVTKPTLVPPQKMCLLPHHKDGLSTYHMLTIELVDKWVQRASISFSFCPQGSLVIIKHQTDNDNKKIHVLDKYSKEIRERKHHQRQWFPRGSNTYICFLYPSAKENNHKLFSPPHKSDKCTQSSSNSSFSYSISPNSNSQHLSLSLSNFFLISYLPGVPYNFMTIFIITDFQLYLLQLIFLMEFIMSYI